MIVTHARKWPGAKARGAGHGLAWAPLVALAVAAGPLTGAQASAAAPQPHSALGGVSCTSGSGCIAVGVRAAVKPQDRLVALGWDGHTWALQSPVNVRSTTDDDFHGVACGSPAQCFGVGSIGNINHANREALIELWNGTAWSVALVRNPKGTLNTELNAASCAGPSPCMAVGDANDNTGLAPAALVERWNGHGWRAQPTPVPPGSDSVSLSGVSCPAASDCTAVGDFGTARGAQETLALHFNGQGWSIEPTPPARPGTQPSLGAVSCSGRDCMALGRVFTTSGVTPLAERFNGTTWSVVPLATPGGAAAFELSGIACTAPSNCYAVGASGGTGGAATTLIEHWDGQAWAVVPSPNAAGASVLTGVSCSAAGTCMAVGRFSSGTSVNTLAMKLSAGHWTITPTPSPG